MLFSIGLMLSVSATAQYKFNVKNATDCPLEVVAIFYDDVTNTLITNPSPFPILVNPQSPFYYGTSNKVCFVAGDIDADGDYEIKISSNDATIPNNFGLCFGQLQTASDPCYNGAELVIYGSESTLAIW